MFRNEQDFDPKWLRRFARTLGLFPVGTRVQLADGAEAMVTAQTACAARPVVRLLSGPNGTALPAGHPEQVTIGEPLAGVQTRIVGVSTHDRSIALPEFDLEDPEVLTQTAQHACLSTALAKGGPVPPPPAPGPG
jgi:hypothetical protein